MTKVLAAYIETAIPTPDASELSFWACSCLPSGTTSNRIYSRISLNMQEVLTLFEDDGQLVVSWHCAVSPFDRLSEADVCVLQDRLQFDVDEQRYVPGGQDQVNIICEGSSNALQIIAEPLMLSAMRLMNLRLMKKGPTYYSRTHCFDPIDHVNASRTPCG